MVSVFATEIEGVNVKTIAISGATGWMGKSAIEAAIQDPTEHFDFQLLSRSEGLIKIGEKRFSTTKRDNAVKSGWDTYVQAAFVTREKAGPDLSKYRQINRQIIQTARDDIYIGRPQKIVFFSSGILSHPEVNDRDSSYQTYASLKQEEREVIYETAENIGATLVEGKLYSATGAYMTAPTSFAIGALLSESQTGSVHIQSSRYVWRRYLDSVQYLRTLFAQAKSGVSAVVESGGQLIELGELAKECLRLTGNDTNAIFRPHPSQPDDHYYSKSNTFENILTSLGERPMDLSAQLYNVAKALGIAKI